MPSKELEKLQFKCIFVDSTKLRVEVRYLHLFTLVVVFYARDSRVRDPMLENYVYISAN